MTDKDSSVPSSELTVDQIAIAFGKWMAGYRKGDELWNDLDQQAVDYVMAGSFIKPNKELCVNTHIKADGATDRVKK